MCSSTQPESAPSSLWMPHAWRWVLDGSSVTSKCGAAMATVCAKSLALPKNITRGFEEGKIQAHLFNVRHTFLNNNFIFEKCNFGEWPNFVPMGFQITEKCHYVCKNGHWFRTKFGDFSVRSGVQKKIDLKPENISARSSTNPPPKEFKRRILSDLPKCERLVCSPLFVREQNRGLWKPGWSRTRTRRSTNELVYKKREQLILGWWALCWFCEPDCNTQCITSHKWQLFLCLALRKRDCYFPNKISNRSSNDTAIATSEKSGRNPNPKIVLEIMG